MQNNKQTKVLASPAERKKHLIAQGAAFRAGVFKSVNSTRAGLQPEVLAKGALNQVMTTILAAFKNGSGPGIAGVSLPALLPLLISGVSALSTRSLLKPVLRGALILGVAGAVAATIVRMKKARKTTH